MLSTEPNSKEILQNIAMNAGNSLSASRLKI